MPWNVEAIFLVLTKSFKARKLRVVYCGMSGREAARIYREVKATL
jgi:hypothetical protein